MINPTPSWLVSLSARVAMAIIEVWMKLNKYHDFDDSRETVGLALYLHYPETEQPDDQNWYAYAQTIQLVQLSNSTNL